MDWKKLFEKHILQRGYDYYCEEAVRNLEKADNGIRADVIGSEDYEVAISLNGGAVTDLYCSCPYAADGRNCKHMAAVLYEWSENSAGEEEKVESSVCADLFKPVLTINADKKKQAAVEALVADAENDVVRSFLASVLAGDEKLLLRFYNTVKKQVTKEDVNNYIRQVDRIAGRYLGRERFISYHEAEGWKVKYKNRPAMMDELRKL